MEEPVEYNAGKKKEERILIHTIRPECKFREMHETTAGGHTWVDFMCGKSKIRNLECDEKCFEQCEWKELIGMTRSEAIERMAKAICSSDGESCKQCAVKNNKHACKSVLHDELFMQYAKSALNALLEA